MNYKVLEITDLVKLVPLYMEYYNQYEECEWTQGTTYKRMDQVITRKDSFGLVLEDQGEILGFSMGYFEQYDDGVVYDLIEIVIAKEHQNQKLGTMFMKELERQVKAMGAFMIQLSAVNDEMHHHFYEKLGYQDCTNLIPKSKILA